MSYLPKPKLHHPKLPTNAKRRAWISAHNWNRSLQAMLDYEGHLSTASSEARGAAPAAVASGSAFAVGGSSGAAGRSRFTVTTTAVAAPATSTIASPAFR